MTTRILSVAFASPDDHRRVLDEGHEDRVGGVAAAVLDGEAARDPLAADAPLRRAVEHDRDLRLGRDGTSKAADERGRRLAVRPARHRVEQVRAVDEELGHALERVAAGDGSGHLGIVPAVPRGSLVKGQLDRNAGGHEN